MNISIKDFGRDIHFRIDYTSPYTNYKILHYSREYGVGIKLPTKINFFGRGVVLMQIFFRPEISNPKIALFFTLLEGA